jgi:NAD(P)-dependent dehydrogenase (short-subunit alcohol dehydrogenase family)
MDMFDLGGRTALVTGGGTGLGRQFAVELARAGATVVLCARRLDKLARTAETIAAAGGRAVCVAMDVADATSVRAAFDEAARHGVADIIVNNAGTSADRMLLEVSEAEWDAVVDTNLKGPWLVACEGARRLIAAGKPGSIINIASMLGTATQKGTGPYSASKAGLIQLTRCMALEWARYQIRVNAIAPGYFSSDMADDFLGSDAGQAMVKRIPQRRLGREGELNGALLLLASAAGSFMTGSVIGVDGGQSLPII